MGPPEEAERTRVLSALGGGAAELPGKGRVPSWKRHPRRMAGRLHQHTLHYLTLPPSAFSGMKIPSHF